MSPSQPESQDSLPLPTLRGTQVYLRPAERGDIDAFVRWFADAEVTQFLATIAPFSAAMEERWFDQMLEAQGKRSFHFVICLRSDDRAIGTVGFHEVDFENGNAAFGISIGEKDAWNHGHGTDALNTICDFGFGTLRLERIWLDVYAGNAPARRSYEKAGFSQEGTLRAAHFMRGEFVDVLRMSLLRDEWKALPRPKSWELP